MNAIEYSGPERRTFVRIIYKPSQRAILKIASHEFEVLDVNESGIRFANPSDKTLATFVQGVLTLLNGDHLEIDRHVGRYVSADEEVSIAPVRKTPEFLMGWAQKQVLLADVQQLLHKTIYFHIF